MLTAGALRSDGVDFDFCIRNRNVGGNLQHGGNPYPSGIVSQAHDADKRDRSDNELGRENRGRLGGKG